MSPYMSYTNSRSLEFFQMKHSHEFLANYISISGLFLMTSYLSFPVTQIQKKINMSFSWSYTMDF